MVQTWSLVLGPFLGCENLKFESRSTCYTFIDYNWYKSVIQLTIFLFKIMLIIAMSTYEICTYLWKYSYFKGIKYVETHKASHLSMMIIYLFLHKLIHIKSSPKKPPKPIAILEFLLNLSANSSLAKLRHKAHLGQELKWWTKNLKRKDNK